jgi:hypothetical protein
MNGTGNTRLFTLERKLVGVHAEQPHAVALGLVATVTRMTADTATRMAADTAARMVAMTARMALPRELAARGDEFLRRVALGAERVVRWDCLVVEDGG